MRRCPGSDPEVLRATKKRQQSRYYSKTAYAPKHHITWEADEIELVIAHNLSDSQLSTLIGRSVGAIQTKRSEMRRMKD